MTIPVSARVALPVFTAVIVAACATPKSPATDTAASSNSASTTTATAAGGIATSDTAWRSLIDQSSAPAWRGYKSDEFPKGWSVKDGVLTKTGSVEDLVTRDQFGDFELSLDWMLSPGGNAGIFYRATEEYDKVYWSGPEYQLLDDARHPDGKSRLTSAGAAYGIYPSPAGIVKPAEQWNSTRIVVRGNHVEHWLNGQKVVEYDLGSPDWEAKVKASKFSAYPNYGRASQGHIAIQGDHDGALSIRNAKIRGL
ncbi:MAG: DUF1080 domain-containing protein [Gemmatimonadaceae bacterium]|nr:DUF1080 domain-containing protein [Gemmatimonadaceae bacterium]NUQ93108.1 DUF1080 domain-containing protein [Gemmatimonadaceae bacterium]